MSSPVFRTTPQDPRRLNMLDHERLPQTHGERRRIHGPIEPMPAPDNPLDLLIAMLGFLIAGFCIGYFAWQLLRLFV